MTTLVKSVNLKKYFPVRQKMFFGRKKMVHAVDDISFSLRENETFGLAGESGCGKTTTGRLVLRLLEPTDGNIFYEDQDISQLGRKDLRRFRRETQIIFQDPYASLNPRRTIRQIISQPFEIHKFLKGKEVTPRVYELLKIVGLSPPEMFADRYSHELSAGQRQRVSIARAVALHPRFIVADEPVSALDVSIRGQILNLMNELKQQYRLSYLFITHDLSVLRFMTDRIAIMYLGKIMEISAPDELYESPKHPYTEALLSAIPLPNPKITRGKRRVALKGEVPSPIDPPSGCRFHTRCIYSKAVCAEEMPELIDLGNSHMVACHFPLKHDP